MANVLLANLINLGFNLIINFALPKYLPVESYAAVKTFTLMVSYAGVFHFGYEDGMYLKYGGKRLEEIDVSNWKLNISSLRLFQLAVAFCILAAGMVSRNVVLFMFALALLPYNMVMYFKQFYQATGEFKRYGYIMNITSILLFLADIILICLGVQTYIWYLAVNNIVYFCVWMLLEASAGKKLHTREKHALFSVRECMDNIRSGFLLMLGNFSSVILTSMDRWFVKILLNTAAFAEYSFAVSLENFINVAVTPVSVTLYNFFCANPDMEGIRKIKNYVLLFSSVMVTAAFPAKFILETWLTSYSGAERSIFLLFCGQLYFIVIKSVYVNLYKARKMQKSYFKKLALVILSGFIFNIVCYCVVPAMEAFAVGTLLSAVLWLYLCQRDFKDISAGARENIYIGLETVLFLFCGFCFNSIPGAGLYLLGSTALSLCFMRKETKGLIKLLTNRILR